MKEILCALICGAMFGFGLALGGMTDPQNIFDFLDIMGQWNPNLALVMGGAIAITLPMYQYIMPKLGKPILTVQFHWPNRTDVDRSLVVGAVLFGLGWGLSGLCPGPALGSIAYADSHLLVFVIAMLLGIVISDRSLTKA